MQILGTHRETTTTTTTKQNKIIKNNNNFGSWAEFRRLIAL